MEAKFDGQLVRESSHMNDGTVIIPAPGDEKAAPGRGVTMRSMKVALIAVVLLAAVLYTWALAPTCDTHISGLIQSTVHVAAPNSSAAATPLATWLDTMATSDVPLLRAAAAYMVRMESNKGCDLESASQQASWAKDDGRRRDIGICVQIRNDAAILDEYIAFHWLQVSECWPSFVRRNAWASPTHTNTPTYKTPLLRPGRWALCDIRRQLQ